MRSRRVADNDPINEQGRVARGRTSLGGRIGRLLIDNPEGSRGLSVYVYALLAADPASVRKRQGRIWYGRDRDGGISPIQPCTTLRSAGT